MVKKMLTSVHHPIAAQQKTLAVNMDTLYNANTVSVGFIRLVGIVWSASIFSLL